MALVGLVAAVLGSGTGCRSKSEPAPAADAAAAPPGDAAVAKPVVKKPPAPAKPARVEHAVWSMVDNRHAAHRYLAGGELVLDAGDIGFARYTRFSVPAPRWHLGHHIAGERAAIADKLAVLELPLADQQARTFGKLVARVHGKAKQVLSLRVNGKKLKQKVVLADGWQTIAFPIAPAMLGIGENQIAFETASNKAGKDAKGVAFAWLRLGAKPGDDDPRAAATFDAKQDAIKLAKDAMLIWYVTIPDGAHLVAEVGGPCKVDVQARASDDSFIAGVLAEGQNRVDLTRMAGRVVGLSLAPRECPVATIGKPTITIHGAEPAAVAKAEPPKYIVLWVMDALRADKVPIFTPGARAQTPNLDELAKTSAVFRQYYVQGNESQTSHSSVWTGLYPAVHNVRLAGTGGTWRIETKYDTLAQKLTTAGLYTAAVTGNGYVNEEGGYARGFREYRNMMRETGVENGIIYGQKIVDAALRRLDAHRSEPTYLFMGTIDTHGPWIARRPWIDIYSPGPYNGPFKDFGTAKDLGFKPGSMGCSIIPPKPDIERLRAIYDSAVSYHDQQVGRLIKQLTSWGIWDQTLLLITADHGEELFEDRRCGHGGSLRESLVRVPLLVHYPARFPGGTVIDEGAEGVDILPTLLDAVGQPVHESAQGVSLVPLANGIGRGWPTPSYASMYEYAHAMRIGRWKMRVGPAGVPIVADLVADPEEMKDLSPTRPVERRMLTDNLGLFLALRKQWSKRDWGVTTNITRAGAAALDEALTP
jgi:arylsulfatase A-like enzyme